MFLNVSEDNAGRSPLELTEGDSALLLDLSVNSTSPCRKSRTSRGALQIGQSKSGTVFAAETVSGLGVSIPLRLRSAISIGPTGGVLKTKDLSFPIVRVIVYSREKFCSCKRIKKRHR